MRTKIAFGALLLWLAAQATAADTPATSVTPAAASTTALTPLKTLVKRYIAWRGGDAFVRAKTLHVSGDVEAYGLTGSFDDWETPDRWRSDLRLGTIHVVTVTTKAQSWSTTPSGQVVPVPDAYKYASRDPQSMRALTGKDGATARLVGWESLDGHSWEVVRVGYGDADTYDEFLDPDTGALGAMRAVEKGQARIEHYGAWREVGAVRLPFLTRIESADLGEQTMKASHYEVDGPIDPALFRRPVATQLAVFAPGETSTGWIPITGLDAPRIYLPVKVGGQTVTALFDSGASSSIIDKGLATTLGVSEGRLPVPGENGVGTGSVEPGVDLGLGGLTLKGLTVGVLDLGALAKTGGETWRAVLGDEVFNETIVDFDFPNRRIAFRSLVGFRPPPDAIALNLKRDGGSYLVPLSLEGGPPANFIMDTGYGGNMRISPGLAQAQHLLVGRAKTKVALEAIGGEADADMITVKTVEFGGVELRNAPAQISQTWPSASFTNQEQGLLGLGILVRFRVIVDWPEDRLYLVPRPDAGALPFARDRLGLTFHSEGAQLVVTGVFENSPAAAAGFRVGDRIDLINGAPASGEVRVGMSAAGTQVVLTMASTSANGSSPNKTPATVPTVASPRVERTVLLRDYY